MRTIQLTEYETTPERLSEDELAQIIASKLVRVSPRTDALYDLRPESRVGTLVTDGLRLLVRPKIGLSNLFFLLSYGTGLTMWREAEFPYAEDDLFVSVAWLLEAEVRRASRFGIVRDYRDREETLLTLRGRLAIGEQIRRRQGMALPLECRYQDYGEDIELNRIIKAALDRLLRLPQLDVELAQQLRHHRRAFAAVEDVDHPPSAVPAVAINRLNAAWGPAFMLARLILQADSVRDETGSVRAISFTIDMNRLFERFVEDICRDEARQAGLELVPQARRRLTAAVPMRPDLVLTRGREDLAVGDAKYKELSPVDWPHADLYQLLAYCVALRLRRGLLIYAEARAPRSESVVAAGITLEIVGVDLSRPPREVLDATRRACQRLIEHAEGQRHSMARAA